MMICGSPYVLPIAEGSYGKLHKNMNYWRSAGMGTRTGLWRLAALFVAIFCGLTIEKAQAQVDSVPASPTAAAVRWSLGDVIAMALANHPLIGEADAEVRAAVARRGQVASVKLPQVDASAGVSWLETKSSVTGDQERFNTSNVQGTVTQLVTNFGRTGASLAQAGDLAGAAALSARWSRVEVAFNAGVAYFNVLRAVNLQNVRRETVLQRESLQRQAQAFFDAGLKARIDVVRAEANLYQARADATGADYDAKTARLILLNQMGLDGPTDFELAGPPSSIEAAGTIEEWLAEAEKNHPDLAALRMRLAAARNARLAAQRGNNPSITASGRLGWTGTDELPVDVGWSIGAQVAVPLFDGHLTREQTAEAEAGVAAAEFALGNRTRQVRLLVEQASQSMRDAAERLVAREKQREAFAENLRLATGRYEAGAADIIEMIDAQVQMTVAETNVVETRFDQALALAALYRALGRLPAGG
jgi:outer membrane protein